MIWWLLRPIFPLHNGPYTCIMSPRSISSLYISNLCFVLALLEFAANHLRTKECVGGRSNTGFIYLVRPSSLLSSCCALFIFVTMKKSTYRWRWFQRSKIRFWLERWWCQFWRRVKTLLTRAPQGRFIPCYNLDIWLFCGIHKIDPGHKLWKRFRRYTLVNGYGTVCTACLAW